MSWCTICKKSFYDISNLRGHAKKFHPDEMDKIAPKKKKSVEAICIECGKSFSTYSNFIKHVKTFHSDKMKDLLRKPKAYNHECDECGKHFMHSRNFNYHKKNHHLENTEATSNENVKKVEKFKCCLCSEGNFKKSEMLNHIEVVHEIKLSSVNLKFSSEDEFHSWKRKLEKDTKSQFINKHGSYFTKNFKKRIFICHRSGTYNPQGSGVRNLKAQGSNKINGYCPAQISLRVLNNGKCEAEFVDVHVGHNQELEHMILTKPEREIIAAKIAAKIPFQTILDEVREESLTEDKLERMHLLTKKDLYNIEQCYKFNTEAVRHVKDAVNVDAWVKEVEDTGCVLFYKSQDTSSDVYPLLKQEDFLLIIMNKGQAEMLDKYSSDCICIDGNYGLNSYGFELVTLLVLDDMREGFPSAFLISNRTDDTVITIFLSLIKNKLGRNLQPKAFMSDMGELFYNAWMQIMGPVENRLFCSWHIDRSWRKNLHKIKTKEQQITVYKMLRTLLQEKDSNAFTQMCTDFMEFLSSNSDTNEFGAYFQEYYLENVQSWAYCYRINCDIHTNVQLEQMHRTLKHIYLNGRVVKRLDKAVNILMKFIRDKLFDKLVVMSKAKICTKIKVLKNRHKASEKLDAKHVRKTDSGFEVPSSSTNEVYLVQDRQPTCNCELVCTECQICRHHYSCTCIDSCIRWNMCKHIHLICRLSKEHSIDKQVIGTPLPAESDGSKTPITEETSSCDFDQQRTLESPTIGKKKRKTDDLNASKEKLKLKIIKLIDSVESYKELNAFEKSITPIQSTLVAMRREKNNTAFSNKIPHNKNII